jgi:hypothetical protein
VCRPAGAQARWGVAAHFRPRRGGPFFEVRASLVYMPLSSDSASGGRRNVFDVPAPALVADGPGDSGGSIFATPQSTTLSHAQPSRRGGPIQRRGVPRRWAARAVALLALVAAPALLGVVLAGGGESDPKIDGGDGRSVAAALGSAPRPDGATRVPASPRRQPRTRRAPHRTRRGTGRAKRPTGGRRRAPAAVSPGPPAAAPIPEPAASPPSPFPPPAPAPSPELAPAPPAAAPRPPSPAAVVPNAPGRPAPARVPEGAPPEFM